jgi:hypothetical protein
MRCFVALGVAFGLTLIFPNQLSADTVTQETRNESQETKTPTTQDVKSHSTQETRTQSCVLNSKSHSNGMLVCYGVAMRLVCTDGKWVPELATGADGFPQCKGAPMISFQ